MKRLLTAAALCAASSSLLGCSGGDLVLSPLALDQRGVTSIVAGGSFIYWTVQSGAIRRVSIDGGEVETVVDDITNPDHVVLDATHVYWTEGEGVIGRAPREGGAKETFVQTLGELPVTLAADDTHLYWASDAAQDVDSRGKVHRVETEQGDPALLVEESGKITSLALSDITMAWTLDDPKAPGPPSLHTSVRFAASSGSKPQTLDGSLGARLVASRGRTVAWAGIDPDAVADDPKSSAMRITWASLDAPDIHVAATDLQNVDTLLADDAQLFFSTAAGEVSSLDLKGGAPVRFASGPEGKTSLAVDAGNVYWAHSSGDAIFALPKSLTTSP